MESSTLGINSERSSIRQILRSCTRLTPGFLCCSHLIFVLRSLFDEVLQEDQHTLLVFGHLGAAFATTLVPFLRLVLTYTAIML